MKAAYVNKATDLVENIVIVNSVNDPVDEAHVLVEIPINEVDYTQEQINLYDFMKTFDSNFVYPEKRRIKSEISIEIGVTKWNPTNGFYK